MKFIGLFCGLEDLDWYDIFDNGIITKYITIMRNQNISLSRNLQIADFVLLKMKMNVFPSIMPVWVNMFHCALWHLRRMTVRRAWSITLWDGA